MDSVCFECLGSVCALSFWHSRADKVGRQTDGRTDGRANAQHVMEHTYSLCNPRSHTHTHIYTYSMCVCVVEVVVTEVCVCVCVCSSLYVRVCIVVYVYVCVCSSVCVCVCVCVKTRRTHLSHSLQDFRCRTKLLVTPRTHVRVVTPQSSEVKVTTDNTRHWQTQMSNLAT